MSRTTLGERLTKTLPAGYKSKIPKSSLFFFLLQLLLDVHFVDQNGLETVGVGDRGDLRADPRNGPGSSCHLSSRAVTIREFCVGGISQ